MKVHTIKEQRESAESFILRAGEFEQQGSSVDEYAVLIEGLRAHYDNYELYFMLGLYYRYRNADQAFLCFENALHYCDEPEDEKIIREAIEDVRDRVSVRGTSIVVVAYNDMELCRECLHAIRRYLQTDSYEVIVVDNASTDEGLLRFLREQAEGDSHIKLIENEKNEGFPVGCNIGLTAANPENDVFFLNNDAILMPNALFWMRMGLYSDKRNGAAGAVTNCAPSQEVSMESVEPYLKKAPMEESRPLSNLSANLIKTSDKQEESEKTPKIDKSASSDVTITGDFADLPEKKHTEEHRWWRTISLDTALETAKSYAKDHNVPMWNPIEVRCRLTGFAMLLRREAINGLLLKNTDEEQSGNNEKLILFDERFSPGYFEDDDLGIRLCLAGWRQILCHNAFIYHNGGSGFADKKDAMEAGRDKFKEKWGFDIWNYTLPEDEKITALMSAIAERDVTKSDKKLRLYNRVFRILDISAGMGNTLSAIKYQMPDSFTAGITNADVFAGLSKFMADDMISGDPELVTFPWPEHSFDYILVGDMSEGAESPEMLLRKLRTYLRYDGQIINTGTET
ncbi:glycosyltransferase family 2 protein [Butyrivibrio sp. XPD2002]|uniref:glycosyltransferase family 2 protein n=1 Tax=Butyrivibrio sp. XPD2002 TaxID=1280665 RepID=UPI0003F938AB|nr:glycosyltransferase family 2 protein [Butyrivibrio sp. XPD2002]